MREIGPVIVHPGACCDRCSERIRGLGTEYQVGRRHYVLCRACADAWRDAGSIPG